MALISTSPVISLLSDLGTGDPSVAYVRAAMMRAAAGATLVDLSHHVPDYDVQQASYLLAGAYHHLPQGAVQVVMTDVFGGNEPRMLLAQKGSYFFIAPDNGVLSLAFGDELEKIWLCKVFTRPYAFSEWVNAATMAVKALQADGELPYAGGEFSVAPRVVQAKAGPDGIECNVLHIDRYENVTLDITREQFESLRRDRPFRIRLMRKDDITTVSDNYGDVATGMPLCRFNQSGYMEIAVNHGHAASLLGLAGNSGYRTVRIVL